MNEGEDQLHPWIDPELGASIVALTLGEASDFESEKLERLLEERPELAAYRERMEKMHSLLGEVVAGKTPSYASSFLSWRLPEDRRKAVLSAIGSSLPDSEVAVSESETEEGSAEAGLVSGRWGKKRFTRIPWRRVAKVAAVLCLLAIVGSLSLPVYQNSMRSSETDMKRMTAATASEAGSEKKFYRTDAEPVTGSTDNLLSLGFRAPDPAPGPVSKPAPAKPPETLKTTAASSLSKLSETLSASPEGGVIEVGGLTIVSSLDVENDRWFSTREPESAMPESNSRPPSSELTMPDLGQNLDGASDYAHFTAERTRSSPAEEDGPDEGRMAPAFTPMRRFFAQSGKEPAGTKSPQPVSGNGDAIIINETLQGGISSNLTVGGSIQAGESADGGTIQLQEGRFDQRAKSFHRQPNITGVAIAPAGSTAAVPQKAKPAAPSDNFTAIKSSGVLDARGGSEKANQSNQVPEITTRSIDVMDVADATFADAPAAFDVEEAESGKPGEKVPALGDLPVTGRLFKQKAENRAAGGAIARQPELPKVEMPKIDNLEEFRSMPLNVGVDGYGMTMKGFDSKSAVPEPEIVAQVAAAEKSSQPVMEKKAVMKQIELELIRDTRDSLYLPRKGYRIAAGSPAGGPPPPPGEIAARGPAQVSNANLQAEEQLEGETDEAAPGNSDFDRGALRQQLKPIQDTLKSTFESVASSEEKREVAEPNTARSNATQLFDSIPQDLRELADDAAARLEPNVKAGGTMWMESFSEKNSELSIAAGGYDSVRGYDERKVRGDEGITDPTQSKWWKTEDSPDAEFGWRVHEADTDGHRQNGRDSASPAGDDYRFQFREGFGENPGSAGVPEGTVTFGAGGSHSIGTNPVTAGIRSGSNAIDGDSIDALISESTKTSGRDEQKGSESRAWRPPPGISTEEMKKFIKSPEFASSYDSVVFSSRKVVKEDTAATVSPDAVKKSVSANLLAGEQLGVGGYDTVRGFEQRVLRGDAFFEDRRKTFAANRIAPPAGLDEKNAAEESFSTFSLHVSDVSFKLAQAALAKGEWPEAGKVRIEEFVNALDYGDPNPSQDDKVACNVEQAIHPFLQQRNLMRVSMRTAAAGRAGDTPLRLTFLLDNSGSMERADREETVRRAFALLADQLQPIDQVTLISFARQPRLLADKVSGDQSRALVEVVSNLPSEGGTNLEAALQLAFEKAQEQKTDNAQNRIVLLTDGAANLGNAKPESLAAMIESMREEGIAFDAAGIGADGLNDEILEALTRKGDGRYYLLDRPEDADDGFAKQIAGALRPAAKNVKVQVEFNPDRVGNYKLLGFEKHRLKKEDFRDDSVDAAEMAAEEAGVAVYQFEAMPDGKGDVGFVSVRFRDMSSGEMVEKRWPIPYEPSAPRPDQAAPSMQIATAAALLAAKLNGEPLGETVELDELARMVSGLPVLFQNKERVQQLRQMIEQARELAAP